MSENLTRHPFPISDPYLIMSIVTDIGLPKIADNEAVDMFVSSSYYLKTNLSLNMEAQIAQGDMFASPKFLEVGGLERFDLIIANLMWNQDQHALYCL